MIKKISLVAISALALAACNDQASTGGAAGGSRQEIRIVGSSTVFPFAKAASEAFAKADPSRKSPVLESTGTGGGTTHSLTLNQLYPGGIYYLKVTSTDAAQFSPQSIVTVTLPCGAL